MHFVIDHNILLFFQTESEKHPVSMNLSINHTRLDTQQLMMPTPEMYCWYFTMVSLSLSMNTMALVGMSDQPMMEKKLTQKREKAALGSVSCSVRGSGLNEYRIYASVLNDLSISFEVIFVTIGRSWDQRVLQNTIND